jgi:hypothetical protein
MSPIGSVLPSRGCRPGRMKADNRPVYCKRNRFELAGSSSCGDDELVTLCRDIAVDAFKPAGLDLDECGAGVCVTHYKEFAGAER